MRGYQLFSDHEHEGPYCVYTLRTAGEVRDSLKGYLLNKPYANAEALAAIGAAQNDDPRISARMFIQDNEVQGAIIIADHMHVPPMQPEALGHVLNFIDRRFNVFGGSVRGVVDMHSAEAPKLVQAWQANSERTAEAKEVHDYHLYSEILEPPALPDTPHLTVRAATPADKLKMLERVLPMNRQQRKELQEFTPTQHGEMLSHVGFSTPYVVEGSRVLQDAVYDVAPISQSGALLVNMSLTIAPWRQPLDYGRAKLEQWWGARSNKPAAGDEAPVHQVIKPAVLRVVQPELTQHFAALAAHFRNEGRWFMFRSNAASNKEAPQILPIAAVARDLGCYDAGSRALVRLSGKHVEPRLSMGGMPFMRLEQ